MKVGILTNTLVYFGILVVMQSVSVGGSDIYSDCSIYGICTPLSGGTTINFINQTIQSQSNGINITQRVVCNVDLIGLTKSFQNFTYVGGTLVSNTSCS